MTARKIIGVTAALVVLAFAQVASAHTVTVVGKPSCLSKAGIWQTVWTITNEQPGQAMQVTGSSTDKLAPGTIIGEGASIRRFTYAAGYESQGSLMLTVQWVEDGRRGEASATVDFPGTCKKPPPPCDGDCSPPDRATSAKLEGPCGDPMYRAVFKSTGATGMTTFRWSYIAFGIGRVTLQKTIAPDKVFRTGYKHIAGGTGTWVSAHGERLLYEVTAPPGTYRACS